MLNTVKKQDGDALTVLLDGRLDTHTAAGFQEEMEPLLPGISRLQPAFSDGTRSFIAPQSVMT